jgi:hypothetical protein
LKRHHGDVPIDRDGLDALVRWRADLSVDERAFVDDRCAWPLAAVELKDGTVGLIMNRAPERFRHHRATGAPLLREIQFAYSVAGTWAGVPAPTPRQRLALVLRHCELLELLHDRLIVFPDFNQSNLLYVLERPLATYLIDCSSAWLTTAPRASPKVKTQFWDDPKATSDDFASQADRDRYHVALLFLRTYYRRFLTVEATTARVPLPDQPPITAELRALLEAGLHRSGTRPDATAWIDQLIELDRALAASGHP